jgi:hypothetical protein
MFVNNMGKQTTRETQRKCRNNNKVDLRETISENVDWIHRTHLFTKTCQNRNKYFQFT